MFLIETLKTSLTLENFKIIEKIKKIRLMEKKSDMEKALNKIEIELGDWKSLQEKQNRLYSDKKESEK